MWPGGAEATAFSADQPDRLRGAQHDALWADELAVWRYRESRDMAMLGLRLGADPRAVVTTTPKPIRLLRELVESPHTAVTRSDADYETIQWALREWEINEHGLRDPTEQRKRGDAERAYRQRALGVESTMAAPPTGLARVAVVQGARRGEASHRRDAAQQEARRGIDANLEAAIEGQRAE